MVTIVPFLPPYISWKHFTLKSLLCVIYPFILTTNLGPSKQFTRKDRGVQSSEVQEDNPSSNDEDVSQGLKPKQLFKSAGWCAASLPASSSPKRNTLVGSDHVAPTFRVPTNKIKVEGVLKVDFCSYLV